MDIIHLTPDEHMKGLQLAYARWAHAKADGKENKPGINEKNEYKYHALGVLGERAGDKCFAFETPLTLDTYHTESDLPNGIEVKTRRRRDAELIIRKADLPGTEYFVLVTSVWGEYFGTEYMMAGWTTPERIYYGKYWNGKDRALARWVMPQEDLFPIEKLVEIVRCTQTHSMVV